MSDVLDSLTDIDGVVLAETAFGTGPALWVNGKEIAHLDHACTIDVRIGRKAITAHRGDERVRTRSTSSDWCEVDTGDASFVRELVELAASQHRAAPGTTPVAPPTGADLERRRRFH